MHGRRKGGGGSTGRDSRSRSLQRMVRRCGHLLGVVGVDLSLPKFFGNGCQICIWRVRYWRHLRHTNADSGLSELPMQPPRSTSPRFSRAATSRVGIPLIRMGTEMSAAWQRGHAFGGASSLRSHGEDTAMKRKVRMKFFTRRERRLTRTSSATVEGWRGGCVAGSAGSSRRDSP